MLIPTQAELLEFFEYKEGRLYWKKAPKHNKPQFVGMAADTNLSDTGYRRTGFKGKRYKTHRLIFMMFHGYVPEILDHKDTDKLNNSIENLRESTHSQNHVNRVYRSSGNKSGFRGVYQAVNGKWFVSINNKRVPGLYATVEEALVIRLAKSKEINGEFFNEIEVSHAE